MAPGLASSPRSAPPQGTPVYSRARPETCQAQQGAASLVPVPRRPNPCRMLPSRTSGRGAPARPAALSEGPDLRPPAATALNRGRRRPQHLFAASSAAEAWPHPGRLRLPSAKTAEHTASRQSLTHGGPM
eukprot:scaffold1122_cov377-Prasinococcus_capsulatus_cf.AAC.1